MSEPTTGQCPVRPVVDFDHHSPALAQDPYPTLAELRHRCPVAWTEAHDGFWVLSDYASVYHASRDDDAFRSGPNVTVPPLSVRPQIPIETDAPETQRYRRMIGQWMSPAFAASVESEIRRDATELIDAFIERGSCDIQAEFSSAVPAITILRLLGFGTDRWREFAEKSAKIIHELAADLNGAIEAVLWLYGETMKLMEDRRTSGFRHDIISTLMTDDAEGEPLPDDPIIDYMLNLLNGGLDTTVALMGNVLIRMDRDRAVRDRLIAEPQLIPSAVEEFLRLDAPVLSLARTLSRDVELGGQVLKEKDRAVLLWVSANRDESVFPDADTFDPERAENRHLAFGVGLHRCLGSNLARSMFRIMLEEVLRRIPDYRIIGDPATFRYDDAGFVYGCRSLPVEFTPGRRSMPVARA